MRLLVLVLLGTVLSASVMAPAAADDIELIQKAVDSYVTAFNAGDAKALAAHWTVGGEFVTPEGTVLRGREQLEEEFTAAFADAKQGKLELVGTKIELTSPSVAVETGIARVIAPEQEPRETEYKAVHVKSAEGWKIDSVREATASGPPPSNYDKLQSLEWMIGTWVDADNSGAVETNCRWTKNRNFIARSFKVRVDDEIDFEGTQVIGWDPYNETIRSWTFDSDGGFAVGRWTGDNGRWTVKSLHVLPDGRLGSATIVYQELDNGNVSFQSLGRQVGGELLPNIGPVEVARSAN